MLNIIVVPLLQLLLQIIGIFKFLVIVRIIISWLLLFRVLNYNSPIIEMIISSIMKLTEPSLGWIRDKLPNTSFDLSPVVLIIGLIFTEKIIVNIILQLT